MFVQLHYERMDDKFAQQKTQFENALARFQELLNPQSMIELDAMIQRFEFTFDLGWKTLKTLLESAYSVEAPTPLQAFQEAIRVGIIAESPEWLAMRDMHNLTSHSYSESTAVKLAEQANAFSGMFVQLKESFSSAKHV